MGAHVHRQAAGARERPSAGFAGVGLVTVVGAYVSRQAAAARAAGTLALMASPNFLPTSSACWRAGCLYFTVYTSAFEPNSSASQAAAEGA